MRAAAPLEEIAVVGGGLAGASLACLLARANRPVVVIERTAAAHPKVCGEFLSIEAQNYLAHLGIDLDRLGASAIDTVRVHCGGTSAEARLPFRARGLSRAALDEALLDAARASGARIERGTAVRSIAPEGPGWRVECASGDALRTASLFLATGKHDIRGHRRASAGTRDDLIGFKTHLVLVPAQRRALEGAVEIVLFPGGYAGLQAIEGGLANLCLLVGRDDFDRAGKCWDGLLDAICRHCPALASRLEGAVAVTPRPLAIAGLPYGFIHTARASEPEGLFRLGDQLAVTPSFTGDGMSIALHSGVAAAAHYLRHGRDSAPYHRAMSADVRAQIRIASLLHDAGRWPAGQPALMQLFRAWPSALRSIAALTRLRPTAIGRILVAR